ncbi:hypothetical protein ACFW9F_22730 [Streptomyces sp. NPDC059506]|uniref:Integral membrane protein n=1 Tax=Streptomyces thermolineatus TaxID=44033 RepID=A0ABN3L2V9_9ACTN|nr:MULTISPECIES: hypothetical protein [unclassified Streptomyces]MCZ2525049.1 hypothetical protein [Streptomyces sp. HB2AG]PLW73982.1 hypothetical protein C0036_04335 [Streptomyces sp. DJ]QMV22592.1 hypothetical protein GQS52_13245 [Streptomyces sp. SCUT-3]
MADNNIDPAGSTQMFRAFVEEQEPAAAVDAGAGKRTGMVVVGVVAAVAVLAAVVWLALS